MGVVVDGMLETDFVNVGGAIDFLNAGGQMKKDLLHPDFTFFFVWRSIFSCIKFFEQRLIILG